MKAKKKRVVKKLVPAAGQVYRGPFGTLYMLARTGTEASALRWVNLDGEGVSQFIGLLLDNSPVCKDEEYIGQIEDLLTASRRKTDED